MSQFEGMSLSELESKRKELNIEKLGYDIRLKEIDIEGIKIEVERKAFEVECLSLSVSKYKNRLKDFNISVLLGILILLGCVGITFLSFLSLQNDKDTISKKQELLKQYRKELKKNNDDTKKELQKINGNNKL